MDLAAFSSTTAFTRAIVGRSPGCAARHSTAIFPMSMASSASYPFPNWPSTSPSTPTALTRGRILAVRYSPSPAAGDPVTASSSSTPKLYTSDFLDTTPVRRKKGSAYPGEPTAASTQSLSTQSLSFDNLCS
ncbi:hypothetical protein BRADI_3g00963v3 [Brachypodium distachyon]|uniref:Uncharacterized protein n=1 Tax=Brachypodium distachyon TaxID=15368 RepID=A0A2K2CUK3_BRADI|nr:hypothetical protein BRADI_3g00963v3 [Brachypodium distachyon]